MRRLYLVGLVILFLGVCSIAIAAPVGNPAKPILKEREIPLNVGAEFDFISERDLDAEDEDVTVEDLSWFGTKISYVLAEKVEPYVLLGVTTGEFSESFSGVNLTYEIETAFSWGLGATVFLYEFDNGIRLGADGKLRFTEPDIDKVILNNVDVSSIVTNVSAEYKEWQVALGISKELGQFVPYGGIKYNDVEASLKATISGTTYEADDINSDDIFGIFIGCDFVPVENISLGIEGRFIDETAFSASLSYRF